MSLKLETPAWNISILFKILHLQTKSSLDKGTTKNIILYIRQLYEYFCVTTA